MRHLSIAFVLSTLSLVASAQHKTFTGQGTGGYVALWGGTDLARP